MEKKLYIVPDLNEYGTLAALTGITSDSTRVDENEATGTLGVGSYDVCYLGDCSPEKGDQRP